MRSVTLKTTLAVLCWSHGCQRGPDGVRAEGTAVQAPIVQGILGADWRDGPFVVLLTPEGGDGSVDVSAEPAVMDQFGITFIPDVLVARVGQPVEFRNSEEIDHNVVAVAMSSGTKVFNVSTPKGDPYLHTFDEPGGYSIVCDIHPGMNAVLLVVVEPYSAVVAPNGSFRFDDVPVGRYRLTVWNADPVLGMNLNIEVEGGLTELDLR